MPASYATISAAENAAPVASDEQYHVMFGPSDVRQVALSRLDEFFRLGVIDEETLVWTSGMSGWQSLRVAAGLDDDASEPVSLDGDVEDAEDTEVFNPRPMPPPPRRSDVAPRMPDIPTSSAPLLSAPPMGSAPPPPRRSGAHESTPPPANVRRPSAIVSIAQPEPAPARTEARRPSASAPYLRVVPSPANPRPATVVQPAAPAARTVPPLPAVQRAPRTSVPTSAQAQPAYPLATPPHPVPASLAPMVQDSFEFDPFQRATGRWQRRVQFALVAAALLGGALTTLYRNDLLLSWANSFQKGAAYLDFEKRWLGGAPAGTPREIDTLLGRTPTLPSESAVNTTSVVSAAVIKNPLQAQVTPTEDQAEPAAADAPTEPVAAKSEDAVEGNAAEAAPANLSAAKSVEDLPLQVENRGGRSKSVANAPVARSRVASNRSRSSDDSDEDRQESRKAKSDNPKPVPGSPDFLEASIRDAVKNSKKSKKKNRKGKKSDSYDPLNGDF